MRPVRVDHSKRLAKHQEGNEGGGDLELQVLDVGGGETNRSFLVPMLVDHGVALEMVKEDLDFPLDVVKTMQLDLLQLKVREGGGPFACEQRTEIEPERVSEVSQAVSDACRRRSSDTYQS